MNTFFEYSKILMSKVPLQFQPKHLRKMKQTVPLDSKGCEIQMNPNAWISDGPLRMIEKGLPIIGTIPPALDPNKKSPMDNFVNVLVERPYMKSMKKMYGELMEKNPDIDMNDPNNLSNYEKQFIAENSREEGEKIMKATTLKLNVKDANGNVQAKVVNTIPLSAHLYTFGGAIPYFDSTIFAEEEYQRQAPETEKKNRTGIYGPKESNGLDASSYIRDIHYSCLSEEEIEEQKKIKDPSSEPVDISYNWKLKPSEPFSKVAKKEEQTIKGCLHTYFNPTGKPFVPIGVEKYFPLNLLKTEKRRKSVNTTALETVDTESSITSLDPSEEMDPRSKLISTDDEDVLFTRSKTLLRRNEIATLRAFNCHWDNMQKKEEMKRKSALAKRNKAVEKAFQSKEVMDTYLKLLDEDCERISSGLIGKSPYKHKSMWEVANEKAPKDPSSLGIRMEFWWRYATFVREIGGIHDDFDKEVSMTLRKELMENHPVDRTLFFDVLAKISDECFVSVSSLKVMEFIRIAFKVEQAAFQNVFDQRNVSKLIYSQTILTNLPAENAEAMKRISKMKIEVPDTSDMIL